MTVSGTTIRTFVALNPSREVQARLEQLQRSLKYPLARAGITWAKSGQIHLTLKFLGDISAGSVDDLADAIRRASDGVSPFFLRCEGLGLFPDAHRPRVIWAGIRGEIENLRRWQERIECETCRWCAPEKREFHPHLTLGRVRHISPQQAQTLRDKADELRAAVFGEWLVEQVELMQSILTVDGAVHYRLATFVLS